MRIGTRVVLVQGMVIAGSIAQFGCGGAGDKPVPPVVGDPATAVNVVVSPGPADVDPGQTETFTAVVSGSTNTGVIWAVNDIVGGNQTVGILSGSGATVTYTAPDNAGDYVVTATSSAYPARRGSAMVRVKGSKVNVSLTPGTGSLVTGASLTFNASVSGTTNTSVVWSVDGVTNGNTAVGTIAGSGSSVSYKAPAVVGIYTLRATSVADTSKSATASITVTAPPPPPPPPPAVVSVALSSTSATLAAGSTQPFTATVSGSSNIAVTWKVDGVANGNSTVGTITGTGSTITYTAPASAGSHTLTATSAADTSKTATASITVTAPPPPPAVVSVTLSSTSANLAVGSAQPFTATVSGSPNTDVTWKVDGVADGNTTVGTITGTGNTVTYTAPATAGSHTLTATSAADTTKQASAVVTVQAVQGGCAPAPTSPLVVSVKTYGAKGDGIADDTAAIQAAIEVVAGTGGTLLVPDGTYMINAILNSGKGLQLRSNMTFRMSSAAVLKAIPNASGGYSVLFLPRVSNVNIIGGTIEGERSAHTGTGGESGMGIFVASSQDVYIEGVTAKECWGDGFYIGGSAGSTNITLCNVVADHNRRQGLSVVYADGVVVRNSTFKNTQGTLPEAGIDIEPNAGETVANMQILGCTFTNNSGGGIQNGLALKDRGIAFVKNVLIDGNVMVGNGFNAANGMPGGGGCEISNTAGHRVTNNVMRDNKNWGLRLRDEADSTTVTGNTITGTQGDGIYLDPTITNYTITGNTVTGNTRYGIYQGSGAQGVLGANVVSGNGRTP